VLRQRLLGGTLFAVLALSLAGNIYLYPRATRPLYQPGDRTLIERTVALAAINEHMSTDRILARTFPITMRIGSGRTCVEMRDLDGGGFEGACYDPYGRLVGQIQGLNVF
jgi:hypothetical protein